LLSLVVSAAAQGSPNCELLGLDLAFALDASGSVPAVDVQRCIDYVNDTVASLRFGPR